MATRLRRAGVLDQKRVPASYLRACAADRLALLQGLMDSDGTISGRYCSISLADEQLARGTLELIRTLGFRPHWHVKPARGTSKQQFHIDFQPRPHLNVFRLPRKAQRYEAQAKRAGLRTAGYRKIVGVEPVGNHDVRCIAVDSRDHLYLAGEAMVPTHNTAFQFAATHKKKTHIQRRSNLAKISSPVEATLDLICDIDEVRAGDVIFLSGCGPGDGRWLVGNCIRSVFAISSQLTLVPALAPLSEQQVAGTVSGASSAKGAPTGTSGRFVSPFSKKYSASIANVDQGVDFGRQQGINTGDPIFAIADCYCRSTAEFYVGSINPQALWFEFASKPSSGYWGWYVAEEIVPKVGVSGRLIKAGTTVATYAASGTGIEIGWAAGPGETATRAFHPGEIATRHNGNGTTDGRNFFNFLRSVGAIV